MQAIVIAFAPGIGVLWLLYAWQTRPERKSTVALLFALGGASTAAALVLNHMVEKYTALWSGAPEAAHRLLFWWVGIGFNEEWVKLAVLLAALYPRRDFREDWQGMLGAAAVALGFAAVENMIYLVRFGTVTLLVRSLLTVPAHLGFTVPMGLCLARSRRAETTWSKYRWLLAGLLIAMGLHGLYDVFLSMNGEWLNRLAYVQVLLMVLVAWRLLRKARHAVGPAAAREAA